MDVSNAFDDLFEEDFGERLVALFPLSHEVQKIAARAQLHNQHNVPLGFERLVELHDGLVPQSEQDAHLVHDLGSLLVVGEVLLVDRLDCDKFSRQLVHAQVDLAEGAPTEHLASPIELGVGLGRLASLVEGLLDFV